MQVNSAQDWLTSYKRRVIAKQYVTNPGRENRRNNTVYTSLVANKATQRERFIVPIQPAYAGWSATYSSFCCVGTGGTLPGSLV
jgi:hypothetical protein